MYSTHKKYAAGAALIVSLVLWGGDSGLLQSSPLKEQSLIEQADRFIQAEQRVEAIQTLERFLATYPKSPLLPDVLIKLGNVLMEQGDFKKAIESFQDFLAQFPSETRNTTVRYSLSQAYLQTGEIENALDLWENVTGDTLHKSQVHDQAIHIYTEREEYTNALRVLTRKARFIGDPEETQSNQDAIIAIIHHQLSETELKDVVSEYRGNFPADEALYKLIQIYNEQEIYHRAEKAIHRFLTLFPHHPYTAQIEETRDFIREKIKRSRYRIAAFLPLSGALSFFGENALAGIQLALHEFKEALPGISIALVVKDTSDSSEMGLKIVESWLNDYKPIAIVGPLHSQDVNRIAPLAKDRGLSVITPGASATTLALQGETVFRNTTTPASQCHDLSEYAVNTLHIKRMALFVPDGKGGQAWEKCVTYELTLLGGKVAVVKSYGAKTVDFKAPILHLKNVLRKKAEDAPQGFDALFLPGDAKHVGLIIPQLTFHNVKGVTLLGTMGWNNPEFLKLVGPHAEGAIFIDGFFIHSPDPLVQNFVQQYRKQFKKDPDLFAAQSYDAAQLILEAIRKGASTPSAVRQAIATITDFPAVSGYIYEMRNGEARKKPFIIQIQKGRFVQINNE